MELEISTDTGRFSEKEVHRNNTVQKTERYLRFSLLLKLQVMELFWELTPSQVFLKKPDQSFHWLMLWTLIAQNNFSNYC